MKCTRDWFPASRIKTKRAELQQLMSHLEAEYAKIAPPKGRGRTRKAMKEAVAAKMARDTTHDTTVPEVSIVLS